MNRQEAYNLLELQQGASDEQIKNAYKQMAKKYHPDVNKEEGAETKFKDINQAYSILTGKEQQKANEFGGNNPFDMFSDMMGININFDFGGAWESVNGRKRVPKHGSNININLMLTAEEMFLDVEKEIKFSAHKHCKKCDGTGSLDKKLDNQEKCNYCKGTGMVTHVMRTGFGQHITQNSCKHCGGFGTLLKNKCNSCQNGLVPENETLKLKISKGDYFKKNNQFVNGFGHAGEFGGKRGRLEINLIVDKQSLNNFDFNRIEIKDK